MADVNLTVEETCNVDPDGGSNPVNLVFPSSTGLNEGATVRIRILNQTSTTTISMQVNSSPGTDKMMSPNDRSATLAASFTGLTVTRMTMLYTLQTADFANPTWWLDSPDNSGNW